MDLSFHSRVVRKLFHNYKHQLHNIMKYQLTLQKELNLKYQQEKQMKQQINKLEDDIKTITSNKEKEETENKAENKGPKMNFGDQQEQLDKKLTEMKKQHEKMKLDNNIDDNHYSITNELKQFINKDLEIEDTTKLREQLMSLLHQIEKERENLSNIDPKSDSYLYNLKNKDKETSKITFDVGHQTEGNYISMDDSNRDKDQVHKTDLEEYTNKINKYEFDNIKLREQIEALKKDLENKNSALDYQESLYNQQLSKIEGLEKQVEDLSESNKKSSEEIAALNGKKKKLEEDLSKQTQTISTLNTEIAALNETISSLNQEINKLKEENERMRQEQEQKYNELNAKYTDIDTKYQQLLKGGDHIDSQTKGFISNLENQVLELKKSNERYKGLAEKYKGEVKGLTATIEELKQTISQYESMIADLNNKLDKATYIIKRASEGEGSILEENENNITVNNDQNDKDKRLKTSSDNMHPKVTDTINIPKSNRNIVRLDKNDKDVEEYLKSISHRSNVIKISKFTQTVFDPIRSLIECKSKLQDYKYNSDIVVYTIDILLKLLGHGNVSIKDLLSSYNSGSKKMGSLNNSSNKVVQNDELYEYIDRDSSPEYNNKDENEEGLYPRLPPPKNPSQSIGQKKKPANSRSPQPQHRTQAPGSNKKEAQVYQHPGSVDYFNNNNDDYYDQYATSKKITNSKPQQKKYTDKDMKEEENRFKDNIHQVNHEDADEYEVYLSKMKIEKELTLFRMYLNIKRR